MKLLAKKHPETARKLFQLGFVYTSAGNWQEAANHMLEGRKRMHRYAHQLLPSLTEREQFSYLAAFDQPALNSVLSLAIALKEDNSIVETAVEC